MRCLVALLARREFAAGMYAFKSMCSFNLTTAPTYQERAGHDVIGIVYDPNRGLFSVGYSEWLSPTQNPRYRTAASRLTFFSEATQELEQEVVKLWSKVLDEFETVRDGVSKRVESLIEDLKALQGLKHHKDTRERISRLEALRKELAAI